MSRTYNAPPSVLRTKMAELGRGFGNALKAMVLWPWMALNMGFGSVLRSEPLDYPTGDDLPRTFFGLRSITQKALDDAERNRRRKLPADPFDILARRSEAKLQDPRIASDPTFARFRAARHAER